MRPWAFAILLLVVMLSTPTEVSSQRGDATFCAVHHFGESRTDAALPQGQGAIAVAPDGSVWTTVTSGGQYGAGAIVKITPDLKYTKVADFEAVRTGGGPLSGLVVDIREPGCAPQIAITPSQNRVGPPAPCHMYGTAGAGGKWGPGTIFRIDVSAAKPAIEVLYDFRNGRPSGIEPKRCPEPKRCDYYPEQRRDMSGGWPLSAPVVVGNLLYGVTWYSNAQPYGTLYSIPKNTAARDDSVLADATKISDGDKQFHVACIFDPRLINDPEMKGFMCGGKGIGPNLLVAGRNGVFYGTTIGGSGSVFQATGNQVTTLHEFIATGNVTGCATAGGPPQPMKDGARPRGLMTGLDGYIYGTTELGGATNWGTVYRLNLNDPSDMCMLTNFPAPANGEYVQGFHPSGSLAEGPGGWLYGVTAGGGQAGHGAVFRMARDGSKYEIIHIFRADGALPATTPSFSGETGNTMYGTAYGGGKYGGGTIYRLQLDRTLVYGGTLRNTNDPLIEVRAGATAAQIGHQTDENGISVRMQCEKDPRYLQFIYREDINPDGTLQAGTYTLSTQRPLPEELKSYPLTTSPNDIKWHPDALAYPSPFFEDGRSAEWDCDSLTLFDRPQSGLASGMTARAVVRDYAICDGKVMRQIDWTSDQTTDAAGAPHWSYTVAVKNATKIPDYFLCLLQDPTMDGSFKYNLPIGMPASQIANPETCTNLKSIKATTVSP